MFALLPDVDQALVAFLTQHAALAPLHGGRVGTALQSSATSIRIANLGGTQSQSWAADVTFQVECWGGDQQQANVLARTVVAAARDLCGPITGGYVTAAVPTLLPLWQPDPNGRPRYIVHLELTIHPEASP